MNVLITGTTNGIGRGIAEKFLKNGHTVYGLDREEKPTWWDMNGLKKYSNFHFIKCDVGVLKQLPTFDEDMNIVINNAGSLIEEEAITKKLAGMYYVTEKYAFNPNIKSVLNIGSNSAHFGIEFPLYSMCNGAVLSYTKNLARRLGRIYQATVNSISPGYVKTRLDQHIADAELDKVLINQFVLKHIQMPSEIGDLAYYLTVVNRSITGQDILIDCGESLNSEFIETPENLNRFYNSMLNKEVK